MAKSDDKIEIENVNAPGLIIRVDRMKYSAMRKALLEVMPEGAPQNIGPRCQKEALAFAAGRSFPKGEKARWWSKTVQIDLDAMGLLRRARTKPLTLYRP